MNAFVIINNMLTSKSAIKAVLNRALAKHFPSKSQAYRADAYRTP